MDAKNRSAQSPATLELVITREFNASREHVWKAWTEPEHVKRWWGPKEFTTPFSKIDFREGGAYLSCMRSPDGHDYWNTGVYRQIVPLQRIVCTDSFADVQGNVVSAAHYGMGEDWPLELVVTLTFDDLGDKTRLTLKHEGFPTGLDRDNTRLGWNESLDKLDEDLKYYPKKL